MKIKKEVLLDFLYKVGINGTMNKIMALDLTADGIAASNMDDTNTALYSGKIKINSVADYTPSGKLGIVDIKFLTSVVNRLYNDIQVDIGTEGVLLKSDTKKILIALGDVEGLELHKLPEKFKPDIRLKVSTSKLKEILSDTSIFAEGAFIELRMEKNAMKFIVGSDQKKERMEDTLMCEYSGKDISSKFSKDIISNIFAVLSTKEVYISFGNDMPLVIEEDTGNIIGTYIVAPFVLPTDTEEKKPEPEPEKTVIEVL